MTKKETNFSLSTSRFTLPLFITRQKKKKTLVLNFTSNFQQTLHANSITKKIMQSREILWNDEKR